VTLPQDGSANLTPGQGYVVFSQAERLHMTVGKWLTGHDRPISHIEVALTNTYGLVKHRLERQGKKR
jgi:hypothetical protein